MKVICNREGLLNACQLVAVATAAREIGNVSPVLRNIKAVVDQDRCTLIATDTEVGIRMDVRSITVEEPGEVLLPATMLLSILREATDDEVTIEADANSCMLRGQHMEYELPGEDPTIFPDFPTFAEDKYHEITAGVLREMIRRTQFAVETRESARYGAMTGILWELQGNKARLIATDGRRMAVAEGPAKAEGEHTTEGQVPVAPLKAMTLLERNLQEPDETVRVSIRPNEILIKTERSTIYSRLVEGRFPDYRKAMPQKNEIKILMTAGPFQTSVRQAAIMTDEETKRVTFSFSKDKLTLQARGAGAGSSKIEMDIDYNHQDDKPLEINFDPKFITDMLRVLDPDAKLTVELKDGKSPALLRNETGDYLYVVTAMVINE